MSLKSHILARIGNSVYLTKSYASETSGYRKWSDGFIEQWGTVNTVINAFATVTLPLAFSSTNYVTLGTRISKTGNEAVAVFMNKTKTSFDACAEWVGGGVTAANLVWFAFGY